MNTKKTVEKLARKAVREYFKKHIAGKNIGTILYDVLREVLIDLGRLLARVEIRRYSLKVIEKDAKYINTLENKTKKDLCKTILALGEIIKTLEEIINPILKEMNK